MGLQNQALADQRFAQDRAFQTGNAMDMFNVGNQGYQNQAAMLGQLQNLFQGGDMQRRNQIGDIYNMFQSAYANPDISAFVLSASSRRIPCCPSAANCGRSVGTPSIGVGSSLKSPL